ncbi:MAG: FlgD immunoglobulin-like domain containing protein [Candidatus Cloacimonadaceae bacterium]
MEFPPSPPISGINKNYPNPFNPDTNIIYGLGKSGNVSLDIYNVRGQRVRNLLNTEQKEGWYKLIWDGSDDRGNTLPSGMYYLRLTVEGNHYLRRITLMK